MAALCDAAACGHIVKALLEHLPSSERLQYLSAKDGEGWTALHKAAVEGHTDNVKALLEHLPSSESLQYLSAKYERGRTALHLTAEGGHTDILKALLEHMPPSERLQYLSVKDVRGWTALHSAAVQGHTESMKALLEHIPPSDRLQYLSVKDEWGWTALHWAAEGGHTVSMNALLDRVPPSETLQHLSVRTNRGGTALHKAAEGGHTESMKALLEHIPPSDRLQYLSVKDEQGWTALHKAAVEGHTDNVKALLEHIPPSDRLQYLSVKDEQGWTALHWAAKGVQTDSVKALLEHIPPSDRLQYLSVKDGWDRTALHCAAYTDRGKLRPCYHTIILVLKILMLSDRFQCLSAQDEQGQTVLHTLSANCKEADLLELKTVVSLTGRFASQLMKIKDKDGKTPVDVADSTAKKLLSERLITYNLHKPPVVLIFYMTHGRDRVPDEMAAIASAFQSICIEPIVCKDFTGHQVVSRTKTASSETDQSAVIVVTMSHGKEAYIEDGDHQPLTIQEMLPALAGDDGIPKVLIMQACRDSKRLLGNDMANSATISCAHPVSGSPDTKPSTHRVLDTFHLKARDVLVVCSTLHGKESLRNSFIPILARHIQQDAIHEDLYIIATKVNREMKETNPDQVPEFRFTMDKSLYIGDFVPVE